MLEIFKHIDGYYTRLMFTVSIVFIESNFIYFSVGAIASIAYNEVSFHPQTHPFLFAFYSWKVKNLGFESDKSYDVNLFRYFIQKLSCLTFSSCARIIDCVNVRLLVLLMVMLYAC